MNTTATATQIAIAETAVSTLQRRLATLASAGRAKSSEYAAYARQWSIAIDTLAILARDTSVPCFICDDHTSGTPMCATHCEAIEGPVPDVTYDDMMDAILGTAKGVA